MKKNVLLMLIFVSLMANAQTPVGTWSIQPKIGINFATMTNDDSAETRVGLVAGAELEYHATPLLSISGGAIYSQQGADVNTNDIKGTIKMDYVNIPVLAIFHVVDGLSVKVGIQPGFLINDKVKVSVNGVSAEVGLKEAYQAGGYNADIASVDFSIPFGVSYEYRRFQFDARYNLGLGKAISIFGESTKHSVFQITIGYKLSL